MPELERRSIFHALSQKSVGRAISAELGRPYEKLNLIIAHMGGGISVGAHLQGRVVDVNNALDGDGPFSPERSGSVPVGQWLTLALSGRLSGEELKKKIVGQGGMYAYAGTKDLRELLKMADEGDGRAGLIYRAMVLQISQEIGRHGATLKGDVHAIGLTGGLARSDILIADLKERVSFLGPVFVYPGEREMEALTENALAALRGEQEIREYVR
jgi:butyrate kinase